MTWSILARDENGHFGVAIASRFFAVGSLCVHTRSGLGAVSTQALMNPLYGQSALNLLEQGQSPSAVLAALTAGDEGREQRQVHVLPSQGMAAGFTGAQCVDWCGHLAREGLSVAGNMLAGPRVIEATAEAFERSKGMSLAERLLAAMDAGESAGGDKRGKQSAALRIHADEDYLALDLRVDDHEDPLTELRRLHGVSLERFQPFLSCLPGRGRPAGITDRTRIDATIAEFHARRGG